MALNLGKCRLCLKLGNFYSIFTEDNNLQLADMAMECARVKIQMDDGLPDKICSECIQKLSSAYIFKQQCERSDLELRQHNVSRQKFPPSNKQNSSCDTSSLSQSEAVVSVDNKNTSSIQKSSGTPVTTKCNTKREKKNTAILLKIKPNQKHTQNQPKKELKPTKCKKYPNKKSLGAQSVSHSKLCNAKNAPLGKSKPSTITKSVAEISNVKYNLKCEKCNKTFKLNIMLKRHLQTCSKSARKSLQEIEASPQQLVNFSCEICTAKFRTMVNLQKHMRVVHTTVLKQEFSGSKTETVKTSVPCVYCHLQFINYHVYCAHFNSCPKRNDTTAFECPICQRLITGKSSYFIHIKTFHFEPQDTKLCLNSKQSSYMCCLCNKILPTPELLKQHLETHQPFFKRKETTRRSRVAEDETEVTSSSHDQKFPNSERKSNIKQKHDVEKIKTELQSVDIML